MQNRTLGPVQSLGRVVEPNLKSDSGFSWREIFKNHLERVRTRFEPPEDTENMGIEKSVRPSATSTTACRQVDNKQTTHARSGVSGDAVCENSSVCLVGIEGMGEAELKPVLIHISVSLPLTELHHISIDEEHAGEE